MKEEPMNPESLAARLIEELKSDPVALSALRGILIPQELLRLPADVADIKQLLAQTVQTQTKMAEMLAEMKDAQNQLIANQAKIIERQDLLSANQAKIIERQDLLSANQAKIIERQDLLSANQAKIIERQDLLSANQAKIIERQDLLSANQAKIIERQDESDETLKKVVNRLGQVLGENLEFKLGFVLVTAFMQRMDMRKFKIMRSYFKPFRKVFLDKIYAAKDDGTLTMEQTTRILATDLVAVGKQIGAKSDTWIAVEASSVIEKNDIDRVKESADLLSLVYEADSIAAAAGYEIPDQTRRYAEESDVEIILLQSS